MKIGLLSSNVQKRREMILNGNILNTLLFLSLPTILMGMVSSLIPLSDGLFLNHTSGYLVAAAVGFGQPIINILNALSLGLGVASMAIVGQINGTGDLEEVKKVSTKIMVFAFFIGLLVAPTSIIFASIVSQNISPEIAHQVFLYLSLYSIVIPLLFMAAIYNAIKNATGQYIAFIDSDDSWEKEKLEKQIEIIKGENINILGTLINSNRKTHKSNQYKIKKYCLKEMLFSNKLYTSSVVLKKQIIEKYNFKEILIVPARGFSSTYENEGGIIISY